MNKVIYNRDLLDEICNKDNCKLVDNNIIDLTCRSRIDFICNCSNIHNKSFKQLYEAGGYCKECSKNNMIKKLQEYNNSHYNAEYLKKMSIRDNFTNYTEANYYTKMMRIDFVCSCGNNYSKSFDQIEKSGGFCKECTKIKAYEKCHVTNLQRYGVKWSLQSKEVRNKGKETWQKTLGVTHPLKSKKIQEKKKETCLEKFGVEHQFNLPEIQEKCKNSMVDKYNTSNVMLVPEIREKHRQTTLENWGVENPFQSEIIRNKIHKTCLEKYNVIYPIQLIKFQEKTKQTCIAKYGKEFVSQVPEISEKQLKNCYNLKSFTFPCGNIIHVQGYEPKLLNILVKDGYTFEDIVVDRSLVPEIWYNNTKNKKCRYYCDIYIPKINTIYEVKSTWTYKKDTENILLKKQACLEAGYKFELYIFDAKDNIIDLSSLL